MVPPHQSTLAFAQVVGSQIAAVNKNNGVYVKGEAYYGYAKKIEFAATYELARSTPRPQGLALKIF